MIIEWLLLNGELPNDRLVCFKSAGLSNCNINFQWKEITPDRLMDSKLKCVFSSGSEVPASQDCVKEAPVQEKKITKTNKVSSVKSSIKVFAPLQTSWACFFEKFISAIISSLLLVLNFTLPFIKFIALQLWVFSQFQPRIISHGILQQSNHIILSISQHII